MVQQNQTYKIARIDADLVQANASTTIAAILGLLHALDASKSYKFKLSLLVVGKAAADIDVAIGFSAAAAVITYGLSGVTPKVSVEDDELMVALTDDVESLIVIEGVITTGANAGNLTAEAAQTTSNASDLSVKAGSMLELWTVSNTT